MLLFDCTWYRGKSEDWYGGKDGVVVAYIHDTLRHLLWVLRCLKISSVCHGGLALPGVGAVSMEAEEAAEGLLRL